MTTEVSRYRSSFRRSLVLERNLPGVMFTAAETVVTGILAVCSQVEHFTHENHKVELGRTTFGHPRSHGMMSPLHFTDRIEFNHNPCDKFNSGSSDPDLAE